MTHKLLIGAAVLALTLPQTVLAGQSVSSIAAAAALFSEGRATRQGYEDITVNVRPLD